ncbi:hypothetical protein LEP1GSC172_0247 [Leptospira noguchii]|uniref:Uncharacterized protein n=2 Tax=Leptospira noguchii TaxID=28182 RepID=T0GX18_9LEPT|nr:hypothetical protein LEP1GSC172_0247 [Leptospira noguchii]EQA71886.1 hypothetical protein LEP1GSC059_0877 [Leptospira noguchii serovar Panama str. CZ214]
MVFHFLLFWILYSRFVEKFNLIKLLQLICFHETDGELIFQQL